MSTTRSGAQPEITCRDAAMADWFLRELTADFLATLNFTTLSQTIAAQPPIIAGALRNSPDNLYDLVRALCAGSDACSAAFQSAHRDLGYPLLDSPDQITADLLGREVSAAIDYTADLLDFDDVPRAAAMWAQTVIQRAAYLVHYRADTETAGRLRTAAVTSLGARTRTEKTTTSRLGGFSVHEGMSA